MRRGRLAALAVLGALLAGACGASDGKGVDVAGLLAEERAEEAERPDAADGTPHAGGDLTATGDDADEGGAGAASSSAVRPSGRVGRDTSAGVTDGGASDDVSGGDAPSASPTGGGTVRIGIHMSKDLQAAYAAFGARGAEGDITPLVMKVVQWINDNGGMGGRKVEPVVHASDPLNGTFDAEGQAACEHLADDAKVFAVVSGAVLPTLVTPECYAKKGVPLVWNYQYLVDGVLWDRLRPNLYMPFSVNASRMGFYVDHLVANRFFTGRATPTRVAIVRYDVPQHERFARTVLRPRLAAHRIPVAEEIAIRPPASAAAAGDTAAQISSGILRLRAANVTHVLFVPTGGAVPFIFMSEAEGQQYRPRYGLNTLDIPYFVADQAPASQLRDALAVGWSPGSDTRLEQQPPRQGARELCHRLTGSLMSQRFCDGLFFLKAALDRAERFDADGLRAAVESLGTSFDPVYTFSTRFGPGRHDGASAIRLVAYDVACECFQYTGPVTPID